MKVLAFLVLAVASSKACFPIPKDHVFDCPAPNGKGLQDVFEKFPNLGKEFLPKLDGIKPADSVGKVSEWLLTIFEDDANNKTNIREEADFKNFLSFLCEKMNVDGDFYVKQMGVAGFVLASKNQYSGELPKEKYSEEFANFTEFIRQSEIGVGMDKLLEEGVSSDPYAQLAMNYFTSPKFKVLREKVLSLPELKEFRDTLKEYKIDESDFIYVFTRMGLTTWSRKT